MKIVPLNELSMIYKSENSVSLWSFVNDKKTEFLNDKDTKSIMSWINKINSQHHNESGFFTKFKNIFSINGKEQILFGQEDVAAIENNKNTIVVRQAEMGVAFGIIFNKEKTLKENWKDIEDMLAVLDVGFNNPKNFHSLILFDTIEEDLEKKSITKKQSVKI